MIIYFSSSSVKILNSYPFDAANARAAFHLQEFFIHVSMVLGLQLAFGRTVSHFGFISIHIVL